MKNAKPSSANAGPMMRPAKAMNRGQSSPSSNDRAVPDTAPMAKSRPVALPHFAPGRGSALAGAQPDPSASSISSGMPMPRRRRSCGSPSDTRHLGAGQRRADPSSRSLLLKGHLGIGSDSSFILLNRAPPRTRPGRSAGLPCGTCARNWSDSRGRARPFRRAAAAAAGAVAAQQSFMMPKYSSTSVATCSGPPRPQHARALRGELRREHAPLVVPLLPPRVGKVDVDRLQRARRPRSRAGTAGRRRRPARTLRSCRLAMRVAVNSWYLRTISMPRKLTSGLACAAVSRNSPLPKPTSISTGWSLPKTVRPVDRAPAGVGRRLEQVRGQLLQAAGGRRAHGHASSPLPPPGGRHRHADDVGVEDHRRADEALDVEDASAGGAA